MADVLPRAPLGLDQRQARYGVVYMRALASQIGCLFNETASGEDVLAVDCNIEYPENIVRVQVKSTRAHAIGDTNDYFTYTAEPHWIERWLDSQVPVYFVVVVVPGDSREWLDHHDDGTNMVGAAAFWVRVDPVALLESPTIRVPRAQRVTASTLVAWRRDLVAGFTKELES